jgi:hypothetical protein
MNLPQLTDRTPDIAPNMVFAMVMLSRLGFYKLYHFSLSMVLAISGVEFVF